MSPRAFVLGLFASLLLGGTSHAQTTPADLVPADASGFVHVPLAELGKSDALKPYRQLLKDSGEAYLLFEKRVVPSISSLDGVTVYVRVVDPTRPPIVNVIVTTTKDIDPVALVKQWLPDAREENAGKGRIYVSEKQDLAIRFKGPRAIVVGPVEAIRSEAARAHIREGPLAAALKKATGSMAIAAFDPSVAPPQARAQVPPPFQPLLKMTLATVSLDTAKPRRIDLRMTFPTAADAEAGDKALRAGMDLARQAMVGPREEMLKKLRGDGTLPLSQIPEAASAVFAVGGMEQLDKLLAAPPLTRKDADLDLAVDVPPGFDNLQIAAPIMLALLVPAVQKVGDAAGRNQKLNNLKQLGLAMHNHYSTYKKLPSAAICDNNGKPLLSWRVAVLPYLEGGADLQKKFKLDEPWDSAHNKKLIPLMPAAFGNPDSKTAKPGETHFRVFVDGGALFDWNNGVRFPQVTDGTSNTLMIAEAAESVPWTAPQELEYAPKGKLPRLGLPGATQFAIALADGSVRMIRSNFPEATLRALITRAGGEVVNLDNE